jgi:hypothetical protein
MLTELEGNPFNRIERNLEVSEPENKLPVDLSILIVFQQVVFTNRLYFTKSSLVDVAPAKYV